MVKSVLVVCSGNLFRSPIAAEFLRQALVRAGLQEQIVVSSAGLDCHPGWVVPPVVASELLAHYGIDVLGHRSWPLSPELYRQADVVLVMEQAQLMRLAGQYPRQTCKLHHIAELAHQMNDIPDPSNAPVKLTLQVAGQLHWLIETGLSTLLHWTSKAA